MNGQNEMLELMFEEIEYTNQQISKMIQAVKEQGASPQEIRDLMKVYPDVISFHMQNLSRLDKTLQFGEALKDNS